MDQNQHIIHNGSVLSFFDAKLHVSNKAIWFNFGVYESVKIIQGRPEFMEMHTQRLISSAKIIGIKCQFTQQEINEWVKLKCKTDAIDNGLLRIILFGDAEKNENCDLYMFHLGLTFYNDSVYKRGATLVTFEGERFMPKAKSINTLLNYIAYDKALKNNAMDALLINRKGFLTEGTRTNFFVVNDGTIMSANSEDILDGVTRAKLLEIINKNNYKYTERDLSLSEVYSAEECFITSTSMNVMPIIRIDNTVINDGKIGDISKRLIQDYKKMTKEYLKFLE